MIPKTHTLEKPFLDLCSCLHRIIHFNEDEFFHFGRFPSVETKAMICSKNDQSIECLHYDAPFSPSTFHCHTPKLFGFDDKKFDDDVWSKKIKRYNLTRIISQFSKDFLSESRDIVATACETLSEIDKNLSFENGLPSVMESLPICVDPEHLQLSFQSPDFESTKTNDEFATRRPINGSVLVNFKSFLSQTRANLGFRFFLTIVGDKMSYLVPQKRDRVYGMRTVDFARGYRMLIELSLVETFWNQEEYNLIESALSQLDVLIDTSVDSKSTVMSNPENEKWQEAKSIRRTLLQNLEVDRSVTFHAGYSGHSQVIHLTKKSDDSFQVAWIDGSGIFSSFENEKGKIDPVSILSDLYSIEELERVDYFIHGRYQRSEMGERFKHSPSHIFVSKKARGPTCTYHTLKSLLHWILGPELYYKLKIVSNGNLIKFVRSGIAEIWREKLCSDKIDLKFKKKSLGSVSEVDLLDLILDNDFVEHQITRIGNKLGPNHSSKYLDNVIERFLESKQHSLQDFILLWGSLSVNEWKQFIQECKENFSPNDRKLIFFLSAKVRHSRRPLNAEDISSS